MLGDHRLRRISNEVPDVLEDLNVAKHPIAVNEEDHRSEPELADAVASQRVIHGGRCLHVPGHDDSLNHILVKEIESGAREQSWHAHSVQHGDVGDVQNRRVLEMDDVVTATPESLVLSHGGLLGIEWVHGLAVQLSLDGWDQDCGGQSYVGDDDGIDEHGLNDL